MIDSTTGMKAGQRYTIDSLERTHHFPGFFLDGKYYLGPELLTAVGWLEGRQFYLDELDPTGEPVFADRLAGSIENLTLIMDDGARLPLNEMPYHVRQALPATTVKTEHAGFKPPLMVAGLALLVGGVLLALSRRARRSTRTYRY